MYTPLIVVILEKRSMASRTVMALAAIAAISVTSANAEEPAEEWNVLGFAFAHHFSSQGQVVKPASSTQQCGTPDDGLGATVTSDAPIPGLVSAPGSKSGGLYIYYRMQAYICQTVTVPAEHRGWQGSNPAIGIEYTRRYTDYSDIFLANFVRDSYGTPSFMLAAGRLWPLGTLRTVRFDGGVVAGIWHRSVLNQAGDGLVRRVVPYALPSLAISDSYTGLGLDVAFAPKMSSNGYTANRTPTLMLQTKYMVHESKRGWTVFKLGTSEQGGVAASVSVAY